MQLFSFGAGLINTY